MDSAEFIVKISKHCNLRCPYCYEYESLADRTRISVDSVALLFEKIAVSKAASGAHLKFLWHGGEPLLFPVEFFKAIKFYQAASFTNDIKVTNQLQTNLTILRDPMLEFLRSGEFFDEIGVSFDVVSGARPFVNGRDSRDSVARNIDRLKECGIEFGCITVMSQKSRPYCRDMVRFFDQIDVDFKILPYYRHSDATQMREFELTNLQYAATLIESFDEWMKSGNAIWIDPIRECLNYAVNFMKGTGGNFYNRSEEELVLIVNTNGDAYGQDLAYDPQGLYGNLLHEDLDTVLASPARQKSLEASATQGAAICNSCSYHGYCPGVFVQNATSDQRIRITGQGCPAQILIDHIVNTLQQHHDLVSAGGVLENLPFQDVALMGEI